MTQKKQKVDHLPESLGNQHKGGPGLLRCLGGPRWTCPAQPREPYLHGLVKRPPRLFPPCSDTSGRPRTACSTYCSLLTALCVAPWAWAQPAGGRASGAKACAHGVFPPWPRLGQQRVFLERMKLVHILGVLPPSISRKGRTQPLDVPGEGEPSARPAWSLRGQRPGRQLLAAGEVGHLTEQVVGLASSQVLALDCWAHMHRAGTSNVPTAWLAQRPQPAEEGAAPGGRVAGSWSPEAGFPSV